MAWFWRRIECHRLDIDSSIRHLWGPKVKLVGSNAIDWNPSVSIPGFSPESIFFGQGNAAQAMQIAAGSAGAVPTRTQLKSLYSDRKGKLPISLMLAVEHGNQISIFGPDPDAETLTLRAGNAINFLNAVLAEPEESLSYQRAISIRRSLQTTDISGFTNNGLFASHYIKTSAPSHPSWSKCLEDSKSLIDLRHMKLIEGLGFEVSSTPANTHVLRAKGQDKRVVAVLLDRTESFDGKSPRFQASPVEWGLNIASTQGAPWLIAMRDSQIRLYPAKDGVGVGQKSQVETYFEIDLLTIDEEKAALLPLIFSAEALSENGTADELLRESQKFAAALGTRLRERVYESIVPPLATEIANQLRNKGHELDTAGLQLAYGLTLRVLFRLLFQAYAEDRGLLPAGRNERFDKNSLKDRAKDLIKHGKDFEFGDASSIWFDHMQIWDAIDQGSPEMQIPAYNGGLFGTDEKLHPEGFLIRSLSVPDRVMGPALRALVIDDNTEDGVPGMVDFRSLSVREFGTIYEGLLESSLSVASQDLTVDKKGAWVPAQKGEEVLAKSGQVYFHSASGERKATGSYYTPSFVVDHLIERSVEPALKNHLAKVKEKLVAGDQAAAYELFFDFRVADLAMGSGHFLVAAIDKIETVMRAFLLEPGNEIEGVEAELKRLEEAAKNALGVDEAAYAEIERASLIRRQIARRCIYGLDINPLAVELSRLAIWIHTFVPGLPMSSLDHGLVCGNSLTGVGSIQEAMNAILPGRQGAREGTLVADPLEFVIEDALIEAKKLLSDAANADEATKAEVANAKQAFAEAKQLSERVQSLFNLAVANRNGVLSLGDAITEEELLRHLSDSGLDAFIALMNPAHLPYLFPEVFLRQRPGFDALVGNPPFKEVVTEELEFWNIRFPGMKGLSNADQQKAKDSYRSLYPTMFLDFQNEQKFSKVFRRALHSGPYPGMGIGDADLYKAFAWRFYQLCRSQGSIGLVLPHSIWNTKGSSEWRRAVLNKMELEVTLVSNANAWVFENVNVGYKFSFVSGELVEKPKRLSVKGFHTNHNDYRLGFTNTKYIDPNLVLQADEYAALPSISSERELKVWAQLLTFPALGDGRVDGSRLDVKCAPATEIHASLDREVFTGDSSDHPVYNHLNVGRYQFDESAGVFNYANFDSYVSSEEIKSLALVSKASSALSLYGRRRLEELGHPLRHPRIIFRDVVHASNQRKVWAALAPASTLLTNKAPYLVFGQDTSPQAQAYLLSILNCGAVDWYTNLRFGLNLNYFIFYSIPVPLFISSQRQLRMAELASQLALKEKGDFGVWRNFGATIENPEERGSAMAEIDYLSCLEFGLTLDDTKLIFDSGNKERSSLEQILEFGNLEED